MKSRPFPFFPSLFLFFSFFGYPLYWGETAIPGCHSEGGTRCTRCGLLDHDVRAGSQWGTARNGQGNMAVVVSGTRLWDGRRCWTTVRKRGMVMWSVHG